MGHVGLIRYVVRAEGRRLRLVSVEVPDHLAWARAVGYPETVTPEGVVMMATRNARVLLRIQGRALLDGWAYVRPLGLDDLEAYGGDKASTASRVTSVGEVAIQQVGGGSVEEDVVPAGDLLSPLSCERPTLSQAQAVLLCAAAATLPSRSSDQKVADVLAEVGMKLARKTVNKYRLTLARERASGALAPRFARLLDATVAATRDRDALRTLLAQAVAHNEAPVDPA